MATIRCASSGGLKVRNAAAGTHITTLNGGDLMYEISGVAKVSKTLNGTSYIWVKVHYYHSARKPAIEGDGWVATEHAPILSTTSPSISDTFFSNSYLKQNEMFTNACYVYNYMKNNGWSDNAIFAMLGNMEEESTINPGVWNGLVSTDPSRAYGIVQWCPSTKLTTWLSAQNKSDNITNQLERILYEVEHSLQWDKNASSPSMTFSTFSTSTNTVSVLADYFIRCYEKPGNEDNLTATRQANAKKWKALIGYLHLFRLQLCRNG